MADQEEMVWNGSDELARSSEHAEVNFVVRNLGETTIRVLEAVSGCGCATPKVEPSTIPPGGSGTVHVDAIPLAVGEKVVPITLKTDSPLTASLALQVRIIGNRRPPFLLKALADLNFNGYASQAETRDVTALTIEPKGPARPPTVYSDLPFVTVDEPVMTEKPYVLPDLVERRYRYRVSCVLPSESGSFQGEMKLIDPWDDRNVMTFNIHGNARTPIHVSPSRLVLESGGARDVSGKLLITTKDPSPDLVVTGESSGPGPCPLVATKIHGGEGDRIATFSVAVRPGAAIPAGEYRLVVRRSAESTERVVVPILVRKGEIR